MFVYVQMCEHVNMHMETRGHPWVSFQRYSPPYDFKGSVLIDQIGEPG